MLDDKYTDGLWYDLATGDIESYKRHPEEENTVIICGIDGEELMEISSDEFDPSDLYRVSEEAIEDPVKVIENELDRLSDGRQNTIPTREYADLKYARQVTTISEN